MRVGFGLVLAAVIMSACGPSTDVGIATASATPTASPSPTQTATPTPSPSPTPITAARAPEITSFTVIEGEFDTTLLVRLHNPNEGVGLIRAGFELTVLAADGAIIDVLGTDGLPGAACCTIYQLPPGGDYGLTLSLASTETPTNLELAVTDGWVDWSTVDPPVAEVTDVALALTEFGGPQVTGRVTAPAAAEDGPFNIWIGAFVDSPVGQLVIADTVVRCVNSADPQAFAIEAHWFFFTPIQGPFTLESVVAYTTTVPGVTAPTPGC
jgi:hypothetical protein